MTPMFANKPYWQTRGSESCPNYHRFAKRKSQESPQSTLYPKEFAFGIKKEYISYKKFRRDKISDKCFDEIFFDEISNETKFCQAKAFAFKNFENSHRKL